MTAAKSTTRRRRASAGTVPTAMAEWFKGERTRPPWRDALAFPGWPLLPERWRSWAEGNPGAEPPPGWQWLADPDDPRHRVYGPALANARRVARS